MTARSTLVGFQQGITLPHSAEWELYHNSFSLCSKKLRVCLSELAIPHQSHHIDLIETGSYENVGRDYLAINPAGLLPVLLHRGHPIYESHEEIVYAAEHAGARGKELMPDDPSTRAEVERWIDCASLVGPDPIKGTRQRAGHCVPGLTLPIFATMVHYIPVRKILRGLLSHPNKERPMIFLGLKMMGIHRLPRLGPAMQLLRQSLGHMGQHLDALGQQLDKHGGPWITGEQFTLADVSWMVILDRLVEADWETILWGGATRPTVAGYWKRLEARKSYRSQVFEMRCPMTRQGMLDVKQAKAQDPKLRQALEGS
jgi:glutathione S-transferase